MPLNDLKGEREWRTPALIHKMLAVDPLKKKERKQNKGLCSSCVQLIRSDIQSVIFVLLIKASPVFSVKDLRCRNFFFLLIFQGEGYSLFLFAPTPFFSKKEVGDSCGVRAFLRLVTLWFEKGCRSTVVASEETRQCHLSYLSFPQRRGISQSGFLGT